MTNGRWAAWTILVLSGCSSDSSSTSTSPQTSGGATASGGASAMGGGSGSGVGGSGVAGMANGGSAQGGSAQGGASGAGAAGGAGTGGLPNTLPICQTSCASPADCASPVAFSDEDNWTCNLGVCEYLGCKAGECSAGFRCATRNGSAVCERECASPQDCAQPSAPFDADNYSCESDGACRYLGCNSDTECSALGDYVCRPVGGSLDVCQLRCQAPADCAQAAPGSAFDADNYTCEAGVCVYQGCNSTSECQVLTPETVCH